MNLRAPAILVASHPYGETATISHLFTPDHGLIVVYVAGGRGRRMRPVMIPGNRIEVELKSHSARQLPYARIELEESRAPWMTEPLPAAAIGWACALTTAAIPERNPHPLLYDALDALLSAICHAPSARGWLAGLVAYETMLLREMGYGGERIDMDGDFATQMAALRALETPLAHYLLADRRGDVMAARNLLVERLSRMVP